ncbi:MAG: gliding motility-associated C-terminal domain-containing protein [Bacteroidota bacterium]
MNKIRKLILVTIFCQLVTISLAQVPSTWTVNPSAYTYQMSVTCKANEACIDLLDPNNYVAAFVGTQCRGVVKTNTSVNPNLLALLTIKSNVVSGEIVRFKIYKASTNTVLNVLDSVVFAQGAAMGTLNNPFVLYTNHAPTDISISTYSVNENTPVSTVMSALTATDQDAGSTFNYSLTTVQPENTEFGISGNNLSVNSLFDYESDSVKIIELQVDDNGGCKYVETFTIHIINANDSPTALTLTTTTIYDHQQAGSYIGQFFTADPDLNDTHIYSLVTGSGDADNSQFYIQNDTLYNLNMVDYNTQSIFFIRARSTDPGALFIENTFTLNVSNVNDAPTNIILSNNVIAENTSLATMIGTLSVVDADLADTHTLTLVSGTGSEDNALFSIIGSTLQTNGAYNFEIKDSLFVRIQTVDPLNATFTKTFVIVVTDVNEAPTNLVLNDTTVKEGLSVGSMVGHFITTDEDFNSLYTYSLVTGPGDTDNALFSINSNSLTTAATYSFTNQTYSIRIRTTDNGSLFYEKICLIVIEDSNYVPTDIIPSSTSFNENILIGTPVTTLSTIDNDATDNHTLTLVSGPGSTDNSYFSIVGNVLQNDSAINFETKNIFYVRIKSVDTGNASIVKTFTFTANDINENPTEILLAGDSIAEAQPANTLIGTFTSSDEDAGSAHTYSLIAGAGDSDNSLFVISGNQLLSGASYTFAGQHYSIRVKSTDNGGLAFEKIFLVKILNVNEAPTDILIDTLSVKEDNEPFFYISRIRSVDLDNPDFYTYSLVSGSGDTDNAEFVINGDKLSISGKANYDVKSFYEFRLKSTDVGGLSVEKAFVLQIEDIAGNEIPLPSTNYISPNGDGENDFWKVVNVEIYKEFELKIFDQFGQVIYSVPNNYNNEFDGKYNGNPLPTGNYYYIFQNDKKQFKGNIAIVN